MFNTYDKNSKKILVKTEFPYFCEKYSSDPNKRCIKFYQEICESQPAIKVCPYGFSCLKTENAIYTSLIIQGNSNYSKVKSNLETYQQKTSDFTNYSQSQLLKIVNKLENLEDINDTYSQTVHDIKNANKSMIDLSDAIESNESVQEILRNYPDLYSLVEGYNLIKYRLDYHDWALNTALPYTKRCCTINIHKIVTKLRYQLKYRALKKNINLLIIGSSYNNFHQQVSLFLGFFLLLENAIKYSLYNDTVTIKLTDLSTNETSVEIINNCVAIDESELPQLKSKGFRAKSAISSATGKGLGLNLADKIFLDANIILNISYVNNSNSSYGIFTTSTVIKNIISI